MAGGGSATTATGGSSNSLDPKRFARDYDKFSPIRQIGAQIGADPYGGQMGIPTGGINSSIGAPS